MDEEIICRCEEITRAELKAAIEDGALTMNELKRLTRAGMGLCQGRTCRRSAERLLAEETGLPLDTILPSTYRQPVRPIKLGLLGSGERS